MPLLLQQELSRVALNASSECTTTVIDRSVLFYHYCIDGYNDKGWGCGYRTLQSIVSSLRLAALIDADKEPSLPDIQAILVAAGEYPASMQHSTTWIGANEAGRFLQHAYNLDYRIIDLRHGSLAWEVDVQSRIAQHLEDLGTPIMCGGTTDNMSRAVLGISLHEQDPKRSQVLIMDPHYVHASGLPQSTTMAVLATCHIFSRRLGLQPSLSLDNDKHN
eukprot:TRINITY_DN11168_c0_g1_i10.p1 TRINITY_DN11168_c0_g1~~TRINITY_DN11168_c0_g1_i10.p1  ORF type:complete len:219 (+),score=39.60 TRINITY_DN11168_c0_g1_i10:96-752(+)